MPVDLYWTLTGDGPTFHISTHESDTARAARIQLLIELAHFSPTGDKVAVSLNGAPLGQPAIRNGAAESPDNPADVDENSWLVWDLESAQAAYGRHEIKVVLIERDPRIRPPLGIENVEIWVTYIGGMGPR